MAFLLPRSKPLMALLGLRGTSDLSLQSGPKRTLIKRAAVSPAAAVEPPSNQARSLHPSVTLAGDIKAGEPLWPLFHLEGRSQQGGQLCRRKQLNITGRLPSTIPTLPDITKKRRSTTTVGIMRKRHIMLTPQVVMPAMPEITPKKRERLTRRNTARSNIPEDRQATTTCTPRSRVDFTAAELRGGGGTLGRVIKPG